MSSMLAEVVVRSCFGLLPASCGPSSSVSSNRSFVALASTTGNGGGIGVDLGEGADDDDEDELDEFDDEDEDDDEEDEDGDSIATWSNVVDSLVLMLLLGEEEVDEKSVAAGAFNCWASSGCSGAGGGGGGGGDGRAAGSRPSTNGESMDVGSSGLLVGSPVVGGFAVVLLVTPRREELSRYSVATCIDLICDFLGGFYFSSSV